MLRQKEIRLMIPKKQLDCVYLMCVKMETFIVGTMLALAGHVFLATMAPKTASTRGEICCFRSCKSLWCS